jgi:hypothetical protein
VQQQDMPQHAQRIMHQRTESTMSPPMMIATMTGHLRQRH